MAGLRQWVHYIDEFYNPYVSKPGLFIPRKPTVIETAERWAFGNTVDPLFWIRHPCEYYWTRFQIRSMYAKGMFRYLDKCYIDYIENFEKITISDFVDGDQFMTMAAVDKVYGKMIGGNALKKEMMKHIKLEMRIYNFIYRFKMHRVV